MSRPRDAQHAYHWLYERAEEAAAAGLSLPMAVQAVLDGFSSIEADRTTAAELSGEIRDVRVSEVQSGDEWLLGGGWVQVVAVELQHPDDRVGITYKMDGEQFTTREFRGFERAAVR